MTTGEASRTAPELLAELADHVSNCDWVLAQRVSARLKQGPLLPTEAAALIVLLAQFPDSRSEVSELEGAGELLLAEGSLEGAMSAFSIAGRLSAEDLKRARRNFARAVGCAELAGARVFGPRWLIALGSVELRLGSRDAAARMSEQALDRLAGVPMLAARLEEARGLELRGDVHAATGEFDRANRQWQLAHAKFTKLGHSDAARVARKIADSPLE